MAAKKKLPPWLQKDPAAAAEDEQMPFPPKKGAKKPPAKPAPKGKAKPKPPSKGKK